MLALQHLYLYLRSYGAILDIAFIKSVDEGIKHLQDAVTVDIHITDKTAVGKDDIVWP